MDFPNHIAIIPDGNRRWAKAHRLNPWEGHQAGVQQFWDIAEACLNKDIKYLTFWAASYDNLNKRSKLEIRFLFKILQHELAKPELLEKLKKYRTRVRIIGEWQTIIKDKKLLATLEKLEQETERFTDHHLTILFAYDGQREMTSALEKLRKSSEKVSTKQIRENLWTSMLPDVDYVIRTGGEPHWSAGFMMWLIANSQFYFTETLWPAFTPAKLSTALADYAQRDRRLGK
jgi:undecaprenyl diphosphate synthase